MVAERVYRDELDEMIPARTAAVLMGVSQRRILQYIADNRLPARRVGTMFLVRRGDLAHITYKRRGRPPKKVATPEFTPA
jgi:excisionase family DNA binding protein